MYARIKIITLATIICLSMNSCGQNKKSSGYEMDKEDINRFTSIAQIMANSYRTDISDEEKGIIQDIAIESVQETIINFCMETKGVTGDGFIDLEEKIQEQLDGLTESANFTGDSYIVEDRELIEYTKDNVNMDGIITESNGRLGVFRKDLKFKDGRASVRVHDDTYLEILEKNHPETNEEIKNNKSYDFELTDYKYFDNGLMEITLRTKQAEPEYIYDELPNRIIDDGGRPFTRMINLYEDETIYNFMAKESEIKSDEARRLTFKVFMYIKDGKIISIKYKSH